VNLNLDPDPIFKTLKRNKTFLGYAYFKFINYLKYSKKVREKIYYGTTKT
jgi:hypothetical protein